MSWQPIPDFPGYEISQDGMVRSWIGRGRNRSVKKPHDVTPVWLDKTQRWAVRLTRDGVRYMRCVANLVLLANVGPPPARAVGTMRNEGDVVFLDGDPTNVSLSNLTWRIE
jgi:hypothetical protein